MSNLEPKFSVDDKIGKLVVKKIINHSITTRGRIYNHIEYECECECGNLITIKEHILMNRKNSYDISCGQHKSTKNQYRPAQRITDGEKIGYLTITKLITPQETNYKGAYYECLCDCGKKTIKQKQYMENKKHQEKISFSCGCQNGLNRIGPKNPKWKGYKNMPQSILTKILSRKDKKEITIDLKYIYELYEKQNHMCALSGIPIYINESQGIKRKIGQDTTASLDRIDSSKGYIPGNVQWVHKDINYMKMDLSQEKFINYCKSIAKHNKD